MRAGIHTVIVLCVVIVHAPGRIAATARIRMLASWCQAPYTKFTWLCLCGRVTSIVQSLRIVCGINCMAGEHLHQARSSGSLTTRLCRPLLTLSRSSLSTRSRSRVRALRQARYLLCCCKRTLTTFECALAIGFQQAKFDPCSRSCLRQFGSMARTPPRLWTLCVMCLACYGG